MSKPASWIATSVGELCSYVTSGSRDWSRYYADEGAYFVRTQDINTNALVSWECVAKVSLPVDVEGKRTLVRGGDLLVTITGANVGKVAEVVGADGPEAYVSQSVALVRLVDSSMAPFVHRHLLSPAGVEGKTELEQRAYGVGRPVLSLDDVRETSILLPPLAEQRRIVAKLDALTSSIDRARTGWETVLGLSRRLGMATLAIEVEHALKRAPTAPAGDFITWSSGKFLPKSQQRGGAIPVFGGNGINGLHDQKNVDQRTLVVGRVGAQCGNVHVTDGPAWITDNAIYARTISDQINLDFVYHIFRAANLVQHSGGTGQPYVNQDVLSAVILPLLTKVDQQAVASRIDAAFARANRLEAEATRALALLDRLEAAIFAKAFRGELVPQDPNDEPANVLLERIRASRAAAPKTTRKRRTTAG